MIQIDISYWFEGPYSPRIIEIAHRTCTFEFQVASELNKIVTLGLTIPLSGGIQRHICPHQITDIIIFEQKESAHAQIEASDRAGDAVLPVKVARPRKVESVTAN